MFNKNAILIVDDEEAICRLCYSSLNTEFPVVKWTTNPHEGLELLAAEEYGLLITDIKMPTMTGLELMHKAKEIIPEIPVIVMTAYATVNTAVQAVREGAGNFIHKPFHVQEFKLVVKNLIEKERLKKENFRLQSIVNLMRASEKIATIHDPVKLHEIVLQAAIHETGAATGKIYHLDPVTKEPILEIEEHLLPSKSKQDSLSESLTFHNVINKNDSATLISVPFNMANNEKCVLELLTDSETGFSKADIDMAAILASQFTTAMDNSALINEVEELFLNTIKTLAFTLDEKDPYTHGHSQRVSLIAREIGERLNLDTDQLEQLVIAGSLHDIGKIGIPDELLQKPGKLTDEEFQILQTHPEKGAKILTPISRLDQVIQAVKTHHEWYDGSGYPMGLKGEEIPILGAIICAADALDTITTDRPYKKKRMIKTAYNILAANRGKQFHPQVVDAVLRSPLTQLESP
ncbi:MAG: response regulator [Calditrichaeota bacterium]|nr:MAG: response regulator [Calditrichota bacterium]